MPESRTTVERRHGWPSNGLWVILGLGLTVRLALALTATGTNDVAAFRILAEMLHSGGRLYLDSLAPAEPYNYPPPWAAIALAALNLSDHTGLPFIFWLQLPVIVADCGIAYMLYLMADARHRRANWAAAMYALNPLPVIIATWHGQFDAIPTLFTLLAIHVYQRQNPLPWAALCLGLGIAFKPFPVLVVPVFLLYIGRWRERIQFCALIIVPTLVLLLPFLLQDPGSVVRPIFGYAGFANHGWAMLLYQVDGILERRGLALPVGSFLEPVMN